MNGTTTITVRVLAYGGKFIGSHVNYANVDIFRSDLPGPIASGVANQGDVTGDGSGDVELIMKTPYIWGTPIDSTNAVSFTAEIPLTEPTILNFQATSVANPEIKTYSYRLVVPGVPLTGSRAVVLVLHGLLADLISPANGAVIPLGPNADIANATIVAQVRMMCGCEIDDDYWPVANFNIQAIVEHDGRKQSIPLRYTGKPSFFSAPYSFSGPGEYAISILAVQNDGNLGATQPRVVRVV